MYQRLTTDTLRIPVIDGEVLDRTVEIGVPWLRPPVTATYGTPRARLARRAAMLRRSPFARHLTIAATAIVDGTWFLLWTAVAGLGLAAMFVGFAELADSFFRAIGAGQ